MDGSSSLPLPRPSPTPPPPPAPQVFLRRPVPPPTPRAPSPAQVRFFRAPSPIPIYTPRPPGPRAAAARPPMPPPPPAPAAAVAPPRPLPPTPVAPAQPLPPLPPPSPAAAAAPPPTLKAVGRGRPKAKALDNEQKKERQNIQSEVSKGETEQGHHKDSTTGLVKGIKRPRKLKGSKHTPHTPDSHGATEGDAGPLFSSNNCRYDSSLGLLTKKFVNLLERAEDGTLDLNKAAETLEVQKRRIYDITNVLEGVDLIEKKLKNMIRWKGFDMSKPKEMERQTSVLKEEIESLYNEDSRLDDKITEAQEKLQALMVDEEKRKWLYLSKEDINKIHHFQGSTLIAINAPHGTYVEVPDPIADLDFLKDLDLQERHYQILLRSSMGPIDCYLISDHQETCNTDQMAPDNLDPVVATGSSQALQQVDYDPSQAQEKGESIAVGKPTSEPSRTHEFMAGILRIVPSDADIDADYWLASDDDVSMTDTWGT